MTCEEILLNELSEKHLKVLYLYFEGLSFDCKDDKTKANIYNFMNDIQTKL